MVTKYDIFEYMHEKGGALRPQEIANAFKKSHLDYNTIYKILLDLKNNKLINKNEYGFQAVRSKKNDMLYRLIKFCISNGVNYNDLLDANITAFISKASLKEKFSFKDFNINPRTFSKYVEILSKYGLLIVISKKPLTATIPYNSFLRDLTAYFGRRLPVAKSRDEYIDEIEKELKKFRRLSKRNYKRYQGIVRDCEIKFVHHSLSIEGNPITLPDTIKLLKDNIIPKELSVESVYEVQNYQKAIDEMVKDENRPLTRDSILNYHYLAMQHKPDIAGKVRTVSVVIKNNPDFKIAKLKEIEPKLKTLLEKYNLFIKKKKNTLKQVIEFSSFFHNEFQHIHPFVDGNSRTTRLITFHLLRSQKVPIFDIPLGLLEEYVFSTKGAKQRHDKRLNQVLQRIILYNLKAVNEKLL